VYLTKRIKSKCKIIQISNSSNFIFNLIFFYIKNPQKYAENEIAFKIVKQKLIFHPTFVLLRDITVPLSTFEHPTEEQVPFKRSNHRKHKM
jgi:hypothetical protein